MARHYFCPKCGQADKGFSKQEMVASHVSSTDLKVESGPEPIDDTTLYWCASDECDWGGVLLEQVPYI